MIPSEPPGRLPGRPKKAESKKVVSRDTTFTAKQDDRYGWVVTRRVPPLPVPLQRRNLVSLAAAVGLLAGQSWAAASGASHERRGRSRCRKANRKHSRREFRTRVDANRLSAHRLPSLVSGLSQQASMRKSGRDSLGRRLLPRRSARQAVLTRPLLTRCSRLVGPARTGIVSQAKRALPPTPSQQTSASS